MFSLSRCFKTKLVNRCWLWPSSQKRCLRHRGVLQCANWVVQGGNRCVVFGYFSLFAHLRFAGQCVHPRIQTRGSAAVVLAGVTQLFWTACELPRWPVIRAHSPSEKRNPITEAGFTTSGPVCHWVSSHPPDAQMSIFMLWRWRPSPRSQNETEKLGKLIRESLICFVFVQWALTGGTHPTWVIWCGWNHRFTKTDSNACGKYVSMQSGNVLSLRIEPCPGRQPGNPPPVSHKGTSPQVYVWIISWALFI